MKAQDIIWILLMNSTLLDVAVSNKTVRKHTSGQLETLAALTVTKSIQQLDMHTSMDIENFTRNGRLQDTVTQTSVKSGERSITQSSKINVTEADNDISVTEASNNNTMESDKEMLITE
ncbi:unnamed protein product, partial [Owenia fusiformis]